MAIKNEITMDNPFDILNQRLIKIEDLLFELNNKSNSNQTFGSKTEEEILTIDQACMFLNLAKSTIYILTSKRILPFFKRGKKLYFKKSELLQWIEDGKKKTMKQLQNEVDEYLEKKDNRIIKKTV